jgi:hypothetical protein
MKLEVGQQEIGDHGCPDLREHGIEGVSKEALPNGLARLLRSTMVELVPLSLEIRNDVAQAATARQLRDRKSYELAPPGDRPQLAARMVTPGQALKFMSGHHAQDLGKNGRMMSHGLVPLLFSMVWLAPPL